MKYKLWITLATYIAYCIDKKLYKAIEYLKTQVEVLIEQQEKQNKRILLSNNQRIKIAAKAKHLSRKMLEQCTVLFTPDTIMRWYNKLIDQKYDGSKHRRNPGRPKITLEIVKFVIKIKQENPRWGYQKITDQIIYLGYKISKSTVKNILIENGLDPEPDLNLRTTWHAFIRSHWDILAACDFFTIELPIGRKLVRCTVFFVIELASRKICFAPIKLQPDGKYMKQVARLLIDCEYGFLNGKKYLIHDRDPLYRTTGFYDILGSSGIKPIKLPARSPDLNCYNAEIQCIERLGGLLKSYHRLAA